MKHQNLKKFTLAAMFLAIGQVLPFFTGQIPQIGNMLLPMHIPVFLSGLVCGWKYGLAVGFVTPLMRSVVFGVPVLFPNAFAMAFELMAYGFVSGFLYERSRWKCVKALYRCILAAMISGRIVWGIAQVVFLGIGVNGFTIEAFLAGAFFNAIPGILLQLIIIPSAMLALNKTGLVTFHTQHGRKTKTCAGK